MTGFVRASTDAGLSREEEGQGKEVLMRFPAAVDTHRRRPRHPPDAPMETLCPWIK